MGASCSSQSRAAAAGWTELEQGSGGYAHASSAGRSLSFAGAGSGGAGVGGAFAGSVGRSASFAAFGRAENVCVSWQCMESAGREATGAKMMTFVGEGEGSYIPQTTYRYVGHGAGDLSLVRPQGNFAGRLWCCCALLVVLAVLIFLTVVYWPHPMTTTRTTTVAPAAPVVKPAPAALPYDCAAGYARWAAGWSPAKKAWCCQHGGKGCPAPLPKPKPVPVLVPVITTTLPFDCAAGYTNHAAGWSPAKKAWCCQHAGKACPTTPTPAPCTTTEAPAVGPQGECTFFGDPHIRTFDGSRPSFYGDGEFWVVRSEQVLMQGRYLGTNYTDGLSATNMIVVSGKFLQGHKIAVGTLQSGVLTVNDQPVLGHFPSTYKIGDLATIAYDAYGELVDVGGDSAHWQKHVVHMDLPLNVKVTVLRWPNYIDLRVEMPAQPGQDGACGNFNGDASDDTTEQIMARIGARVSDGDLLFKSRVRVDMTDAERKMLSLCPKEKLEQAKVACRAELKDVPDKHNQMSACILDECYGSNNHALKLARKMGS